MTALGRTLIAIALICGLVVLLVLGKASEAGCFGLLGIVAGYVFGDRNGEKRLAAAIVTQQSIQPAVDAATPKGSGTSPAG